MNHLLKRQLRKYYGTADKLPAEWLPLLEVVSDTYDHYDKDRKMTERSIDLSSKEMIDLNLQLRKEKEELSRLHKDLETLFDSIEEVFFTIDVPKEQMLRLSPACEKIYGYPMDDFFRNVYLMTEIIHPDDYTPAREKFGLLQAGQIFINEYRIYRKDGTMRWVETKIKPAIDEKGILCRIDGVTSDITTRKEAEEKLRQNEERLRFILDNEPECVKVVDLEGRIMEMNVAGLHMMGVDSLEEVKGQLASACIHPEDRERFDELHARTCNGEELTESFRAINMKQKKMWVETHSVPLRSEAGVIYAVLSITRDVTDRMEIEKKISDERLLLRTLIDNLPMNIYAKDLGYRKTLANRADCAFMGVTDEQEALGKDDFSFFDPEFAKKTHEEEEEILTTGQPMLNKMEQYTIRDGSKRWFLNSKIPLRNHAGTTVGLVGISYDITENKETEEQIRFAKERYDMIAAVTNDAIYEWDIISDNITWGEGYEVLFGHQRTAHMPIIDWIDMIHPDDKEQVINGTIAAFKKLQTSLTRELRIRCADGSYKTIYDKLSISYNEEGRATTIMGAMHDITAQKAHERAIVSLNEQLNKRARELAESNEELERFAYVASHDLQEPLRMVSSFLQLLQKKYKNQLDATANQYIDFAVDGADRMKQLILDLLEYSRVNTNKDAFADTPMANVVDQVLKTFENRISKSDAVIQVQSLPVVKANGTQMVQLMQNLVGNALKYNTSFVPEISIGCNERPDTWEFYVRDNGIGIDPKFYDKIFVIFQRLHNKKQFSGTGIGLAICKKIVEKHAGKIWIQSAPGQGSTFYFSLKK